MKDLMSKVQNPADAVNKINKGVTGIWKAFNDLEVAGKMLQKKSDKKLAKEYAKDLAKLESAINNFDGKYE